MQSKKPSPPRNDSDSVHSSLRASVLEHLFLGQLLRALWNADCRQIQVLRSEVDSAGYDVVVV